MQEEKRQTVLIVEDDWELADGIAWMLEKEGFMPLAAHSVREAEERYQEKGADLVLLDVNLPDGEGFDFCQYLREKEPELGKVPVLFLTARDLEEDALKGYELGAQDYVTKPFSMKILLKKDRRDPEKGAGGVGADLRRWLSLYRLSEGQNHRERSALPGDAYGVSASSGICFPQGTASYLRCTSGLPLGGWQPAHGPARPDRQRGPVKRKD